jgi:TM2 domain-containing membrane protein YozV/predicted transcriptional regulator
MAVVQIKSKGVAYLLLIFLGWLGVHRFYLEKIGTGIIYLCTLGLFGIGLIYDLFTLGHQVDMYNIMYGNLGGGTQNQNVVVNVTAPTAVPQIVTDQTLAPQIASKAQIKISAEKEILALADKTPTLTLRQVMSGTNLDMEEAENAIKKLISNGIAKEEIDPSGKSIYKFEE